MSIPKLRFKGFSDKWISKSVADYANINPKTGKIPDSFIYIDLESVKSGALLKENEIRLSEAPSRAQRVLSKGDILFQMVRPYQGNNLLFEKEGIYVASTGYAQIKTNESNQFFYQLFHTKKFLDEVMDRCTGTSYPAIDSKSLGGIKVSAPGMAEQQKIASFLAKFDQKISLLSKKHELLIQYKKGVMQKIFSQEIRFKDKNSKNFPESKRVFLGDIAQFYKGKGISKSDISSDGLTPCIRYGELYTQYGVTISEVISKTNAPIKDLILSKANDVIIPASGETQIDIATASCVIHGGIALGGDLNIIRTEQSGVFLCYYLNSEKKLDIAKLAQGNSVVHLYASQLKGLEIELPTLAEQELIANFLSLIDKKIALCNAELIATKRYKQGLLQQMFI